MGDSLRAGIRAGDADAFAELFGDTSPEVHRMALRATGGWARAEGVVSPTFLEIWRLRQTVRRENAPLRPFVPGGLNVLRNQSRSARRHRAALARLPAGEHPPDFAHQVADRIADAEQGRHRPHGAGRPERPAQSVPLGPSSPCGPGQAARRRAPAGLRARGRRPHRGRRAGSPPPARRWAG
ncbi:RNA polymerase sigma factor [Streptomyces sp. A475]|uniref:RNA polymerase sigma factor n=1 Tax=Streptomyces sp. A475 TaxID=3131976 RepID=UPI0030C8E1D2